MNKQTTNRIVDLLSKFADSLAEQERTVRALATEIQTLKYDVTREELEKPAKEEHLTTIEKLLQELLEEKKKVPVPGFPFDTHPHITPYISPKVGDPPEWMNQGPFATGAPQVTLCTNSTYAGVDKVTLKQLGDCK